MKFKHDNTIKRSTCTQYVLEKITQGLNTLKFLSFLIVSINFQMVFCPHHPIISIFGSRFSKIYFPDLFSRRAHMLRTLFNIQAGEGSYLENNRKFQTEGS